MPPDETIRHQVETWRKQAREQGVVREENLPFFLQGTGPGRPAVLLVHGFSASPWEMSRPAEYLAARGHACLAVRLPGHGTSPEDLRQRSWQEWLAAVRQGADLLTAHFPNVVAAGSSTGSLLILLAALEAPLQRLALLSPYLQLQHLLAPFANLIKHVKPYQEQPKPEEIAPFFYERRPLAGVEQINLLRNQVKDSLAAIRQPCLVLCSAGDQTVDPASARELYEQLGSEEKEFHCYGEEVPHVLTIAENPLLDDTLERLGRFLK